MMSFVNVPTRPELNAEAEARRDLLNLVMRRQASLSLKVASIFVAILVALPLVNLYLPRVGATEEGGFTLTWLLLGILFYPITWVLSTFFVRRSEQVEAELAISARAQLLPSNSSVEKGPNGEGDQK